MPRPGQRVTGTYYWTYRRMLKGRFNRMGEINFSPNFKTQAEALKWIKKVFKPRNIAYANLWYVKNVLGDIDKGQYNERGFFP